MAVIGVELDVDELVLTRGRDFKWQFENLDDDKVTTIDFPAGQLYFELLTGGEHNAKQQVTIDKASGGNYKLNLDSHATANIAYDEITVSPEDATPDIQSAIEALPNVGAGNVTVHPAQLYPVWEFDLTLNSGTNEIQQIIFNSGTTGGKYRLSHGIYQTALLTYGVSTAADVQAALRGLTSIGAGNCNVTAIPNGFQVEFVGSKANTDMDQIIAWSFGFDAGEPFFWFTLTGTFPSVQTSTVVQGTSKFTDALVNVLNKTVNDLFNSFDTLIGVDIEYKVIDNLNTVLKITSLKAFSEADLATFVTDISNNLVEGAFNGVSALVGLFDTIHVDFYWKRIYTVEFVGALANTFQPKMTSDITGLTGLNSEQSVEVDVIKPGKARFTKWPFTIDHAIASIKVESEQADLIPARTDWQLVFLADGEPAGGDAIARGRVMVQQ